MGYHRYKNKPGGYYRGRSSCTMLGSVRVLHKNNPTKSNSLKLSGKGINPAGSTVISM